MSSTARSPFTRTQLSASFYSQCVQSYVKMCHADLLPNQQLLLISRMMSNGISSSATAFSSAALPQTTVMKKWHHLNAIRKSPRFLTQPLPNTAPRHRRLCSSGMAVRGMPPGVQTGWRQHCINSVTDFCGAPTSCVKGNSGYRLSQTRIPSDKRSQSTAAKRSMTNCSPSQRHIE